METGASVSRGCFSYKGKKKSVNIENYCEDDPSKSTWNKRLDVYQRLWEEVDTDIQILQSDLNTKIFDDLLNFAKTTHNGFALDSSQRTGHKEIPTAALVTGVNTPDHAVMFSNLATLLQERVSPLVATLQSKDCNNVKNTLTQILGQILKNPQMFLDDEDTTEVKKNLPCSLLTLVEWYKDKYSKKGSSPKKRKSGDGTQLECDQPCPPVVLVFTDLESFLPRVLQDFITICNNYISRLPMVFVFGIATSVAAVHRILPNSVSSMLCMEKFQAPPSTEYLTLVVNQILMTPRYPFKMGQKVFQLLIDIFLYHDFSVLNFIKGLQFSMMDHMFSNPLSHLCCPREDVNSTVKKMSHTELETLRRTPSFMRHVESGNPEKIEGLLLDDNVLKNEVEELILNLHTYHELFFPVLQCLHTLVAKLPRHPLGKQVREVYAHTLGLNMFETEAYKTSIELLKLMSKDELTVLLQQCVEKAKQDVPEQLNHLPSSIGNLLEKFENFHDLPEEKNEEEPSTDSPVITKTDLHSLKKQLQEMDKRKKKLSPYEKLRNEIVDFFDDLFKKYLQSPKTLPLHEVLYYDAASVVRGHLNASPRSAVQTALGSPQVYLQSEKFEDEGGINPNMPDICIVYKLHLECSQLINLYDWLQAFVTVVTAEDEENEEKIQKPDKVMQARFIRAVSELQFLGFVKPTKRKTDHVARLTWGGC